MAAAADQRARLTTIVGTVRVWNDREVAAGAWQRWIASRPTGSVRVLASYGPIRPWSGWTAWLANRIRRWPLGTSGRVSSATPFDVAPPRTVSSIWVAPPNRWRAETRAEGGAETGVMVLDGDRGGFAVIGRDHQGVERVEPNAESPLGLHAIVMGMIDAEQILGRLSLVSTGSATHQGRECYRLVGSLSDTDDFPVWPADSYEVLLDRRRGILLKYTAMLDSVPYAGAEFSEVAFDVELPADTFSLTESPDGHRWPVRTLMSVS